MSHCLVVSTAFSANKHTLVIINGIRRHCRPFGNANHGTRRLSAMAAATSPPTETSLLHPDQDFDGVIPYPTALSPSAAMEFKNCPQSYLFQYLYKLRQPTNDVLAKGTFCHTALEKVFDLDPSDRSLENLQNLFRSSWSKERKSEEYKILFEREDGAEWDVESEREWGRSALQLLDNYYHVEDPRNVVRPNPVQREVWVRHQLTLDPALGVTAPNQMSTTDDDDDVPTFLVRGIVDRIDMVRINQQEVALRIVDYKTGKAPHLKYSPAMNEKIANDAFYQLKIYALLLRERSNDVLKGMDLRLLRLFHLNNHCGQAEFLDMDLGATQEERDVVLHETHQDLAQIWKDINALVDTQDPTAFVGCDRSFCYCHKCRPRFYPGTVWESADV